MKRMSMLATALTTVTLAGCSDSRREDPDQAASIVRGETLFQDNCARCHPRSGRGDYLKRIPATLLVRRSEAELIEWIQGSDKHREMPNFTDLSEEQKLDLASYLLSQVPPR